MSLSGIGGISSGSCSSNNPGKASLDQYLKDSLQTGDINQTQFDSALQAFKDLKTRLQRGPDATDSGDTGTLRDHVSTVLTHVGLKFPAGMGADQSLYQSVRTANFDSSPSFHKSTTDPVQEKSIKLNGALYG